MARVAALAVVLAALAGTPAAAATGVPVWPAAGKLALPVGANTSRGHQAAALQGVACTSAGNCVAVGYFTDATKSTQAMAVAETGGAWGRASELTLPAGANTAAGAQQAQLSSVACTGPGSCVAVGRFTDGAGSSQAMIVDEASGAWGGASELTLPAGADVSAGAQAGLSSVACTSSGNCVAVGFYTDSSGSKDRQAMVASETSGVWGQASELALPAGANTGAGEQDASLRSVACAGPGSCAAVGSYTDTGKSFQAMVVAEGSGAGVWGQASELALPADALGVGPLAPAGARCGPGACLQTATLDSVTCTGAGSCEAVGSYADDSTECSYEAPDDCGVIFEAMAATATNGAWGRALNVSNSSSGAALSELAAVACTGPGSCVGVGQQAFVERYMAGVTYEDHPAFLTAETNGGWGQLQAASLPAGAAPVQEPPSGTPTPGGPEGPEERADLDSVACTSPGNCVAVGYYLDNSESTQAMVLGSVTSLALITKQTISSRRHSARFSFRTEGETRGLQCALVRIARGTRGKHRAAPKPRYASCHSHKRYTRLAPGRYAFYVRTVGAGAEKTPASRRFTIG